MCSVLVMTFTTSYSRAPYTAGCCASAPSITFVCSAEYTSDHGMPVGVAPIARTVSSQTGAPGVRIRMPFRSAGVFTETLVSTCRWPWNQSNASTCRLAALRSLSTQPLKSGEPVRRSTWSKLSTRYGAPMIPNSLTNGASRPPSTSTATLAPARACSSTSSSLPSCEPG